VSGGKGTTERGLEARKPIFSLIVVMIVLVVCVIGGVAWFFDLLEGFGSLSRLHEPMKPVE
jgi:hypothetical protein